VRDASPCGDEVAGGRVMTTRLQVSASRRSWDAGQTNQSHEVVGCSVDDQHA
jgi:hypothetical protein